MPVLSDGGPLLTTTTGNNYLRSTKPLPFSIAQRTHVQAFSTLPLPPVPCACVLKCLRAEAPHPAPTPTPAFFHVHLSDWEVLDPDRRQSRRKSSGSVWISPPGLVFGSDSTPFFVNRTQRLARDGLHGGAVSSKGQKLITPALCTTQPLCIHELQP